MPLATVYSEPLSEVLEFMDHWSDNFTAEMVLKTIGYKTLGQGTTAAGAAVTRRDLVAAGIPVAAFASPTARASPATTASPPGS